MTWVPELPLFRHELLATLRTRRAFWLLVATVGLSSLIPLAAWPGGEGLFRGGHRHLVVLQLFMQTQLILCLLIIPSFAAGAISGERERGTYELLHATLIPPASIALSKIAAILIYMGIMLLASAPATCVLYLLGGTSFTSLVHCYTAIGLAIVLSALICLKDSVRSERTSQAAVRGVVGVAFWNFGLFMIAGIIIQFITFSSRGPGESLLYLFGTSPFMVIAMTIFQDMGFGFTPGDLLATYAVYAGLLSLGHFLYVLRRTRNPYAPVAGKRKRKKSTGPDGKVRRVARPWLSAWLLRRGRRKDGWLGSNPLFLKEVASEQCGRLGYRRSVFWLSLLLFVAIAVPAISQDFAEWLPIQLGAVALFLIFLLVPAASAGSLPRERELKSLDLLRSTLLSPLQIVGGKFFGCIYSGVGIVVTVTAVILVSSAIPEDSNTTLAVVAAGLLLGLVLLFTAALVTFLGTLFRRALSATIASYVVLLVLLLFLPLLGALMGLGEMVMYLHPFSGFFNCVEKFCSVDPDEIAQGFGAFFGFATVYALLTLGLFFFAVQYYESEQTRDV